MPGKPKTTETESEIEPVAPPPQGVPTHALVPLDMLGAVLQYISQAVPPGDGAPAMAIMLSEKLKNCAPHHG